MLWSVWSAWSYKEKRPDQIHRPIWSDRPVLCPEGGTDGLGLACRSGPDKHVAARGAQVLP